MGLSTSITIWLSVFTELGYLEFRQSYHSLAILKRLIFVRWVGKRDAMALPTMGIAKDYNTRQILEYTIQSSTNTRKQACGHQK
jgi:hypothetical protein